MIREEEIYNNVGYIFVKLFFYNIIHKESFKYEKNHIIILDYECFICLSA